MAVTVAGLVLAALAACDRRAWPFLGVVALSWGMTSAADHALLVLAAIWARLIIDALGVLLAWVVEGRSRPWVWWMGGVRATFALMLLAHSLYWLSRSLGVEMWLVYAHGLNLLSLLQLLFLAGPIGWRLTGPYVTAWIALLLALISALLPVGGPPAKPSTRRSDSGPGGSHD